MAPKKAKAASKSSKATKTSKTAKGSKATKTTKASKVSKTSKASKTPKATQASTATQSLGEPEEPEPLGRYQRKRAMPVEFAIPHKKGKLEVESPIEGVDEQDVVVDMEAFEADLDHSYVDELAELRAEHEREFPPPIKPERATWTYNGPLPLNDTSKLPEGWTWDEPDLDKLDIDAQIERCHERIAEQILPFYFEHRLREYQAAKDIQE
ncbi:uncharacterized protein N7506_001675 [Penicillium brevicompactum]|uniref:uncharacterized protein n=1 Tax=Penicillium brevicompactum TaxID=5074 RepID=UPI0025417AE2|nr:uncharacterized protein N7506_001675 [Penicillium brevicompactum]KAJ5348422.1 hypothetical protein N7506_001675 [Penicillium brevicompactum]